ncbi:MAG: hypothetical protein KDC53_03945 [Saprospiraceae bacterium]|nr:hypothetical protein [Saprospiraceae bacterium]
MKNHFKRNWFWYLIIVILLGGNLYFYAGKKWSERQSKIKLDEAQITCNDKIATITEQNHVEEIKRQASFYASLVRDDIYKKSWSDVRNTLTNIVRETMITQIDFVTTDDEIEVSTNRKSEGGVPSNDLPKNLFSEDASVHIHKNEQGYLLSVPVYDNNMFLGRLLMQHSLLTSNINPE